MDINTLRTIQALPQNAVFGLISDSSKECYISYTSNLKARIGLILTEKEDILKDDTRLVVFESGIEDLKYKMLYAQHRLEQWTALGYKNIGNESRYINYKVKVQYSDLLNNAIVLLVNKRKDKLIVGVFKTVDEANRFTEQYYSGDELVQPIYAINKETVRWIRANKVI